MNGDIVIQNPVGSAEDLAREFIKNCNAAFDKQIHTNRKNF